MRTVGDLLLAKGIIDDAELRRAKQDARTSKTDIDKVLTQQGVAEKDVLEAKSELLGIPAKSNVGSVGYDILRYISEESARHYQMVPIGVEDSVLEVGMVKPENLEAREALQFISSNIGMPFKVYLISFSAFEDILKSYQGIGGEVSKAIGSKGELAVELPESRSTDKEVDVSEDAPITKTVTVILRHAVEGKASDVHIEPSSDQLRVRFRVDGVLYTSILLPMNVHEAIISRIKIMTNMKIDERRKPQDGRFRARIDKRDVDFRVSTFPTYYGEKVALRILDPDIGIKTFEQLGIAGGNQERIEAGLKRPFGMILITGPTGSGKSTTLYSMLKVLNDEKRNIVSLEDPIEYYVEGINQSQIRPEIEYTFASGLRSILRQDPDVIMVGEIRDRETAQLAVHAALTGHLVLTTLHTNDAIGVIPRLIDMGVDPFLIPSTLVLAMAQRLVRTLCPESRKEIPVEGHVLETLRKEIDALPDEAQKTVKLPKVIYEGQSSPSCPKGNRGRFAVAEVLLMTPELEKIVLEEPSEHKIAEEAHRQNMITMRQDGVIKALNGTIGLEELFEVVV
jgi:type IV pilus assembly protein PilB